MRVSQAQRFGDRLAWQVENENLQLGLSSRQRVGLAGRVVGARPIGPRQIEVGIPSRVLQQVREDHQFARCRALRKRRPHGGQRLHEFGAGHLLDGVLLRRQRVDAGLQMIPRRTEAVGRIAQNGRQLRRQIVAVAPCAPLVFGRTEQQVFVVVRLADAAEKKRRSWRRRGAGRQWRRRRQHVDLQFFVHAQVAAHRANQAGQRRVVPQRLRKIHQERRAAGNPRRVERAQVFAQASFRRPLAVDQRHRQHGRNEQQQSKQQKPPSLRGMLLGGRLLALGLWRRSWRFVRGVDHK